MIKIKYLMRNKKRRKRFSLKGKTTAELNLKERTVKESSRKGSEIFVFEEGLLSTMI
jgi:hypothetical protein